MKNRMFPIVQSGYIEEKVEAHFKMTEPYEMTAKVSMD